MTSHSAAKLLAAAAISQARQHPDWTAGKLPPGAALITTGGIGLSLRKRPDSEAALILNVRDGALAIPGSHRPHSHRLGFEGIVIVGEMRQHRYIEHPAGKPFQRQRINNKGKLSPDMGGLEDTQLIELPEETYREGDNYAMRADEIHGGVYIAPGTVTLISCTCTPGADPAGCAIYVPPAPGSGQKAAEVTIPLDWAKVDALMADALASLAPA